MADLEQNLRAVRARIDAAARAAGRDPATVALLAVSKTWPADDVRTLVGLGQRDFGENRAQELLAKAAELTDVPVRWHFVGQLQRNKAAAVARLGAVVHSVDRGSLAGALDRVGQETGRPVGVLVQVDLGGAAGGVAARGGADPAEAFARLAALAARVRADHPEAVELSAGMSGDLEAAVAAGATVVRVGTALFGDRHIPSGEDPRTPATRVTPVTEASRVSRRP